MKNEKGKAYVYVRNWDLRQYDNDILKKYDLEKLNYWYIGSTQETLAERRAKFKYQMINQVKSEGENSERYVMNKTSIFINNLVRFYREELKLSENDIDKLVFEYYEKLELDLNYIDELQVHEHQLLESKVIGQYVALSQLRDRQNKILSLRDGYVKIDFSNGKITSRLKNNTPMDFSLNISIEICKDKQYINPFTELETVYKFLQQDLKGLQHYRLKNDIIRQ